MRKITSETAYEFRIEEGFEGEPYEDKGCYFGSEIEFNGNIYKISFYDQVRLSQTIKEEVEGSGIFFEPNLIVIERVSILAMEQAVRWLIETGEIGKLVSKPR